MKIDGATKGCCGSVPKIKMPVLLLHLFFYTTIS